MAVAGYLSTIYKPGTPTTMTDEACSLVSGKIYRVTDDTKRVFDPTASVVVKDNAGAVAAADILSLDYLFGKVEFVGGYTVVGAITITADYLPMTQINCARAFTFSANRDIADDTCFNTTSVRSKKPLLKDCSLSFDQLDDVTPEFETEFNAGTPMIMTIGPGVDHETSDALHIAARVVLESTEESASFDGLVENSVSAVCAATISVDGYPVSFGTDL